MSRELTASVAAAVAVAVALAAPRAARACGPDFPIALLHDRADTLGSLPEGEFLKEVAYLVEPDRAYPYVAGDGPVDPAVRAAYNAGLARDGRPGIAAYRRVRALVDAGLEDRAGLALSSLGQEARLHLRVGEDVAAVRLYAEQAALGHPDGATSLLFVVRDLVDRGAERPLLRDPVGQRLLATYLATRSLELADADADRLWRELGAIAGVAGADQLAAYAYQRGAWARAATFAAAGGDAPMARWVAAKLALRDGDRAGADRLLAQAADGFRTRSEAACHRITGERATIAVGQGRMTDALALAWEVRDVYPDDLTYVAERVVTIPELSAFVADLPGAGGAAEDHELWATTPASLRALLGRRLMRAGRYGEALAYLGPSARSPALAFALAITRARDTADPTERARALYQASRVARQDGLEILGTAGAPDWEDYGAQYDRFAWEDRRGLDGRGVRELARVAASAPARSERYHYRHVAADLAERAAALVPPRSQAYTATLCWAAHYLRNIDQPRVETLWWLAIRRGAAVDGMDFPGACPEPDFEAARHTPWVAPPSPPPDHGWHGPFEHGYARRWLGRLGLLAGGFALIALLGLALTASHRRWRRFAPRP